MHHFSSSVRHHNLDVIFHFCLTWLEAAFVAAFTVQHLCADSKQPLQYRLGCYNNTKIIQHQQQHVYLFLLVYLLNDVGQPCRLAVVAASKHIEGQPSITCATTTLHNCSTMQRSIAHYNAAQHNTTSHNASSGQDILGCHKVPLSC